MDDFSTRYDDLIATTDVADISAEIAELQRQIGRMDRERREIDQQIPFWDRLMFFSDSPDEQRRNELESQLEQLYKELDNCRESFRAEWSRIETHFVPLEFARLLDEAIRQATERLGVGGVLGGRVGQMGPLRETLHQLADRLVELYVPGFDPETAFDPLESEEDCRQLAAGGSVEWNDDERLGFEPIDVDALQRAMARRLLDSSFFDARRKLPEHAETVDQLERALTEADADVSTFDTLNVFSDSIDEIARDKAEEKLQQARIDRKKAAEQLRHQQREAISAFPPMAIYAEINGALGVLDAIEPRTVRVLQEDGSLGERQLVEPRSLLLSSLQSALQAFREAFPGVRTPGDLREEFGPTDDKDTVPTNGKLQQRFFRTLDAIGGQKEEREALVSATMIAALRRHRRAVAEEITWFDRAVFWSDTDAEAEEEQLETRESWHIRQLDREWGQLLDHARGAGASIPALRARDHAIEALAALHEVHTDGSSSSTPKSCPVYGRDDVIEALGDIEQTLRDNYGLQADRQTLMSDVAQRLVDHEEGRADAPEQIAGGPFRPLGYDAIVESIAANLMGTNFPEAFERVGSLTDQKRELSTQASITEGNISFWDTLNIFSSTPEEQRYDQLEAEIQMVQDELGTDAQRLNAEFEASMSDYPPARVYYMLDGVVDAVNQIRAVCRSRTVTRGTGDDRETDTEYYCDLEGRAEALAAMRAWNQRFIELFGPLPGYHDLLLEWVREDLPDAGGSAFAGTDGW